MLMSMLGRWYRKVVFFSEISANVNLKTKAICLYIELQVGMLSLRNKTPVSASIVN